MNGPIGEEIVHIIPLGFEIDRAVKPFEMLKANRAYILTICEQGKYSREHHQKQNYYLKEVKKRLMDMGIQPVILHTDTFDLLDVLRTISKIITKERNNNNIVYVNMSASGRLTSVGSTLAAMAHGAKVYYVVADRYPRNEEEEMEHGLSICDNLNITFLENFQLQFPDKAGIKILVELSKRKKGMMNREILDFLRKSGEEGFKKEYGWLERGEKANYLMKLNKGILEKLRSNNYITIERYGRSNLIKITESGRYVANISGMVE